MKFTAKIKKKLSEGNSQNTVSFVNPGSYKEYINTFNKGDKVIVDIYVERTLSQNDLWKKMVRDFLILSGYNTFIEAEESLKTLLRGEIFKTSEMSYEDMSILLTQCESYLSNLN